MTATARARLAGGAQVVGLADFQRQLRAVHRELPRALRQVHAEAAQVVVARGRSLARTRQAAKAASTMVGRGEQRHAKVLLGSARVPWAAAANFGAHHNRPRVVRAPRTERGVRTIRGWNQFPDVATLGGRDVFFYRAIGDSMDEFVAELQAMLDDLFDAVFPDPT